MRFRYFGKTQLGKYSANFNWKVPLNGPYKVWLIPWQSNKLKKKQSRSFTNIMKIQCCKNKGRRNVTEKYRNMNVISFKESRN